MSKIKEPHLFEALYHAASRRLEQGGAPTRLLFPKQDGLVRAVGADYLKNHYHAFEPRKVLGNLTPRDARSDANRFSGLAPSGPISENGGLYTSRHTAPMINEVWHYASKGLSVPRALAEKGVIQLRVIQSLNVLDLSRYAASTSLFLASLEGDPDVHSALQTSRYKGAHLEEALLAKDDYTVGRSLGLASANSPYVQGLQVGTARPSDRKGETGDNLVLYGPNGQPLHSAVRAEKVILFGYSGKTKEVKPEQYDVQFNPVKQEYETT